jgi:uncharacterized protein with GYD domain
MPHYMMQFSYSASAIKAMVDKPQDREAAAKAAMEAAGGKLLHFFFTFGEHDGLVITELPDNAAAASVAMLLGASGAATQAHTTVLMTTHEAQAAMQKAHDGKSKYKPPHG